MNPLDELMDVDPTQPDRTADDIVDEANQPELQPMPMGRMPIEPPKEIGTGMFNQHDTPPRVDVLVPTSVPDETDLWAARFASASAEHVGPTALIQLQPRECIIRLFGRQDSMPEVPYSVFDQVDWAISWVSWFVKRTILVPSAGRSPGAYLDWDVPIHLMTGHNDAAIVDTYRLIKWIVDTFQHHQLLAPALDLVVVDSPPELAASVAARLGKVTRRFLEQDLPLESAIERKPPHVSTLTARFGVDVTYGCDNVLETLDCVQRDRTTGRLGSQFR